MNGMKRMRFPTRRKHKFLFRVKSKSNTKPSSPLSHLHHPPCSSPLFSSFLFFSFLFFQHLYNCFFTLKRRTFSTVQGSLPFAQTWQDVSPTHKQGSPQTKKNYLKKKKRNCPLIRYCGLTFSDCMGIIRYSTLWWGQH